MKLRPLLLAACLLSSLLGGAAAVSAAGGGDSLDSTQSHWAEAKSLMARGAYRDALQELEIILSITPDDPWAKAYKSLCIRRLSSEKTFAELSPEQLFAVQEALRREEQAQRSAQAQQKSLERRIQQEQSKWDREVKALTAETLKAREAAEQTRQREAKKRLEQIEARQRQMAQQLTEDQRALASKPQPVASTSAPAPTATAPSPEASTTSAASPTEPEPSPEASVAPAAPAPGIASEAPSAASPSPAEAPAVPNVSEQEAVVAAPKPAQPQETVPMGPRAVQIFGDQMNVSPERHIAVAEGNVRVVYPGGVLTSDKLTLFTDTKDVYAQGHVRLERGLELIRGELVHYNVNTNKGRILQGTAYQEPWYEHGRVMEHIAEGVLRVKPGYVTSCEFEPPHFRFQGRRSTVFAGDKILRSRNVALFVEKTPLFYFPWLSVADRQSPFFIIPGKKKPWGPFALMGYRYELPSGDTGTLRLDWRRYFGWGVGVDQRMQSDRYGSAVVKLYYNPKPNSKREASDLPKGADQDRYRVLVRHLWMPMPDTTMVTDLQKFSDVDYRREMLFREEFVSEVAPGTDVGVEGGFISWVTSTPAYTFSALARKRLNRFSTVTEAFPDATVEVHPRPIGEMPVYVEAKTRVSNFQTKRTHSENDSDVVRVDWFEQLSYALDWLRPVLVTPKAGVRQTYYTKDKQGGAERPDGRRDVISGQASTGADASLKFFKVFPFKLNWLGMPTYMMRHVLTPAVSYEYIHRPTVPDDNLEFPAALGAANTITFSVDNKLQTKRAGNSGGLKSVDLARLTTSIPYRFHGTSNKQGGRLGEWNFDLELYPTNWLRIESDWKIPSHFQRGQQDARVKLWNLDAVMVGGRTESSDVHDAKPMRQPALPLSPLSTTYEQGLDTPQARAFQPGPQLMSSLSMLPVGQWYAGLGHRFSHNDKVETVLQFDWRLTEKWQIGTYHRLIWKEVSGSSKRFSNMREWQYTLTRDLHDWMGELAYRVDREFGEELFLTFVLKAYPEMPIEMEDSYHEPKFGTQSSPFSPLRGQHY